MYGSYILCKWLPQFFLEKITSINENIFSFFYKRRPPRAFPFVLRLIYISVKMNLLPMFGLNTQRRKAKWILLLLYGSMLIF